MLVNFLFIIFVVVFVQPVLANSSEPLFQSLSKKQEEALVVKVNSADTLVLENGKRIKLIGVESIGYVPAKEVERDQDGRIIEQPEEPTIPIEEQALTFAQELLENKKVRLEFDSQLRSPEGYVYAYAFLPDGVLANTELLRMGFVHLSIAPPNMKYAQQLRAAYQEAREQKRGVLGE